MRIGVALTLTAIACGTFCLASQGANREPSLSLQILTKVPSAGSTVKGSITIFFAEGLHGYQNPPAMDYQIPVTLQSDTKGIVIKPAYPKGKEKEFMGEKAAVYEGKVAIPFTFVAPQKTCKFDIKVKVGYQQCNDSGCFPPTTKILSATLAIRPKAKITK